jgi:hypothetical protein
VNEFGAGLQWCMIALFSFFCAREGEFVARRNTNSCTPAPTMNNAERWVIWFLGGTLATAAVAWVALQVQQEGVAPAGLFSIAVGAAIGGAVAAIGRWVRLPGGRGAAILAVGWGLAAVVGQDYFAHRERMRAYDEELARQHPLAAAVSHEADLRPNFADYLAGKVRAQPLWWTVDLLVTAAAAGVVAALGGGRGAAGKDVCTGGQRSLERNLK